MTGLFLKVLRKIYVKCFGEVKRKKPDCIQNPNLASDIIYDALIDNKPCMIARFGANELNVLMNYMSIKSGESQYLSYIQGKAFDWHWNKSIINNFMTGAGFFPISQKYLEEFCELMLKDIPSIDILGSWLPDEVAIESMLGNVEKIQLELLNPYFSEIPWTKALEGKKVLVVHPFAETIERQYKKRELLFQHNLLPEFDLKTVKAVQGIAGNKTDFKDWFEALDYMKSEIDKIDYDICLIGCGAYGFPLAAHVKRMEKKGFHLGGSLQLLFGIRGKRWEHENYNSVYNYAKLVNEHWVKPDDNDRPANANSVEGACYW
jgi:hypothetical protein